MPDNQPQEEELKMRIANARNTLVIILVLHAAASSTISNADEFKKATMYKPLSCGCCDTYAEYLESNGFSVEVHSLPSLREIKQTAGVPEGFEGCHTLLVDGYTVDGLVPIATLNKLLTEKPDIKGITLPGMPWGAPGMEQRPKASPLVIHAFESGSSTPWIYAEE